MRTSTICWYRINRWFTLILCGLQQQHTNSVRTATTAYYYREDGNNRIPLLCGLQQQHTNTLRIANIRILIRCGRQPQHTNTVRTAAPAYQYWADFNNRILLPCGRQQQHSNTVGQQKQHTNTVLTALICCCCCPHTISIRQITQNCCIPHTTLLQPSLRTLIFYVIWPYIIYVMESVRFSHSPAFLLRTAKERDKKYSVKML